jgi:hypothetical protein
LYPTKSRPDRKIDAAVALMIAIGRHGRRRAGQRAECFLSKSNLWITTAAQ